MGHNSFGVGASNLCIGYSSLGPVLTFRIANASIGIGTTTPNYKLDVTGSINTSDSYYINGV